MLPLPTFRRSQQPNGTAIRARIQGLRPAPRTFGNCQQDHGRVLHGTTVNEEQIHLAGTLRGSVDRCFKHNTIEDILEARKEEIDNKEWAEKTLKTLSSRSPAALKVTLRLEWTI
jgi:enoyl-CoA hydratase/isomerase-like protein